MLAARRGRVFALSLTFVLFLSLLSSVTYVRAATPQAGTVSTLSPSVSWSGSTLTNDQLPQAGFFIPTTCTAARSCDEFLLTLSIPSTLAATNQGYYLNITIRWSNLLNQYGLYIVNSTGSIIAVSLLGSTTQQFFELYQPQAGTYEVFADSLQTVPGTPYSGSATLVLSPLQWESFPRQANYVDQSAKSGGTFSITPDVRLVGAQGGGCTIFCGSDGEPEVKVDQFGTVYASATNGVPGGSDFWRSTDGGQTFTYLGEPDGSQTPATSNTEAFGVGGGDDNLLLGQPFVLLNASSNVVINSTGRIYLSSLWLGSSTVATSINRGNNWVPSQSPVAGQDRQWGIAEGTSTYYIDTSELVAGTAGATNIVIVQSTDGGVTFPRGAFIGQATSGQVSNVQGPLAVGPDGTIYAIYVPPGFGNEIVLSKCPGPCTLPPLPISATNTPFVSHVIINFPAKFSAANVFPQVAVDSAGNVYVAWSDGRNVYLMSSTDGGNTWSTPVVVNSGPQASTALEPWLQVGDPGRVGIAFRGSGTVSYNPNDFEANAKAQWIMTYAFTPDALDSTPTFYQTPVSGGSDLPNNISHVGAICTNGLACPGSTRNLLEYSAFTVDGFGNANFVFSEDANTPSPIGIAVTDFVRQTAGPTFFAPSLGRAVGQGHFSDLATAAKVHFDFKIDSRSKGLTGQLSVLDQSRQVQVSSLSIASFSITGNQATFAGTATYNNGRSVTSVTFTVKVTGNQGLNSGQNFFSLTLSNGYTASGYLTNGNILVQAAQQT
ncbi:MAG TPA: post-COAP-1 domain-containing protein [Nitrososphaerales archaeon]|nr:post-COAP-1 domain-containing protein [Nitrososphaerales archaeon]